MYHSIDITTFPSRGSGSLSFNTYRDFYLVPTSIPIIATPGVKTKSIDVPGANGVIDLTESLTPYPTYKNRNGSIEFALLNDRTEYYNRYQNAPHSMNPQNAIDGNEAWAVIYSDLVNKLHGRKCRLVLEDDPSWYYEGRIAVGSWKTSNDGKWPIITFNYDLAPYKLSMYSSIDLSTDNWLWDPFSFRDGIIYNSMATSLTNTGLFKQITVDSNDWVEYKVGLTSESLDHMNRDFTGWMPVCPQIDFSAANMGVKIVNAELGYDYEKIYTSSGTKTDPECILYDYLGDGYSIYFKGTGNVTLTFRKGSL